MLRKGTILDENGVYALMCALEETQFDKQLFHEAYQKQCDNPMYESIVYTDNNDVVIGILNMRFEYQLHHCCCIAEILEFVIDEKYRSQGIGNIMFQEALRICNEKGCSQLELDTNQKRKDAHRFYERQGMQNTHYKYVKVL